jgi:hypothetical protein
VGDLQLGHDAVNSYQVANNIRPYYPIDIGDPEEGSPSTVRLNEKFLTLLFLDSSKFVVHSYIQFDVMVSVTHGFEQTFLYKVRKNIYCNLRQEEYCRLDCNVV